jgi:hypothetical protein
MGFAIGLSVVLAGCAVKAGDPPTALTPMAVAARQPCSVAVFPGLPPFAIEDLGPIQASCPSSKIRWSTCGIDQANLLEVACSSGADTVFGLYEVMTPAQGRLSNDVRVMHARLGRRRPGPEREIGREDHTSDRLK